MSLYPAETMQPALDRAIDGDPERADPPKPLDVLDMMAEARESLAKADNAPSDQRGKDLADAADWAGLALATWQAEHERKDKECRI